MISRQDNHIYKPKPGRLLHTAHKSEGGVIMFVVKEGRNEQQ